MEKLRLKNGTEFDLIPMGSDHQGNTRKFVFTSDLSPEEIKGLLVDAVNVSEISHVLADGSCVTYADVVGLISLTDNVAEGNYIVVFSTDATARKLEQLQAEINELKALQPIVEPPTEPEPIEDETEVEPVE